MRDVKGLVRKVYGLQVLALCYVAAYVALVCLWAREESLATLTRRVVQACAGMGLVLIALGGLIFTGFDAAFTRFHELSFGNNFWQLDPARDHLVQMFPDGFWQDATLLIAAMTVVELLVIGAGAFLYLRRHPEAPPTAAGTVDESADRPG